MDFRVSTDQLVDRGVYLVEQNEAGLRFGAYNQDKKSFIGLQKSATREEEPMTILKEEGLDDPFQGIFGTIVPVEYTSKKVPPRIQLQVNVWGGGEVSVWVPNTALIDWLYSLELEGR